MTDEEILKDVDQIVDGLAYDIREYAKRAVKYLRSNPHPSNKTVNFIEYVGPDEVSGPIVAAAVEEVLPSHTGFGTHRWLAKEIRRIFDAEEAKS